MKYEIRNIGGSVFVKFFDGTESVIRRYKSEQSALVAIATFKLSGVIPQ